MLSKKIEIRNMIGLHARPAAMIAQEACKYRSQILIRRGVHTADAKNSVRVLAMAVNRGDCIELIVSGEDEASAFECLDGVFNRINTSVC